MAPRYNELTGDRRRCLQVVADHGGRMSHEDGALAPFCDDGSTLTAPDVFNQCHDAEWLRSWHDRLADHSVVELTDAGKAILAAVPAHKKGTP